MSSRPVSQWIRFAAVSLFAALLVAGAAAFANPQHAFAADNKIQIVGTPTVYVQSGNTNIVSIQVKNISGSELKGVNVAHGYGSYEDYVAQGNDEPFTFTDGYSEHTTIEPLSGYEDTWYRFTRQFNDDDHPAVNAVWNDDEEGYTIAAGATATLWFKVNSQYEEPGTYSEWIRFGDIHSEPVTWFYSIPVVDSDWSGECAVNVVVYNPVDAAILIGTGVGQWAIDLDPIPLGQTIDFGTYDLATASEADLEDEIGLHVRNTTAISATGLDEHGGSQNITVELMVQNPSSENWNVTYPFGFDSHLSYGMHWDPLPPVLPNELQEATGDITFDASDYVEGTYNATFILTTMPHGVSVNGSALNTNGVYEWPVTATLTGTNPRIPKAPANVAASPGNGLVELTWDAAEGASANMSYDVYRREGSETQAHISNLNNAQFNWDDYECVAGSVTPDDEGNYLFVDGDAENGTTYTYIVIGGYPLQAYPAISASVTPLDTYDSKLLAPGDVFGNDEVGGVRVEWEMNEVYGGDKNDGSSMVDHFNIYRDDVLVAQVQQNAVNAVPEYGLGPDPDNPDAYIYRLPKVEYGWDCFVETPVPNQTYYWKVAAVSKSGVEGYVSEATPCAGLAEGLQIVSHNAYANLEWDFPYWDEGDWETKVEVVSVNIGVQFANWPYLTRVDFWRAEGTNPPNTNLAPYHTNETLGSSADTEFKDLNVEKGKTYTYTVRGADDEGRVSNYYTFSVKVPTGSDWSGYNYNSSDVNWKVLNGRTVHMDWYADYEEADDGDYWYRYTGIYKVYRDGQLMRTYNGSDFSPDDVSTMVFEDDPGADGTYVYRMDKIINGILITGQEYTFTRNTAPVDENTFLKPPSAPTLSVHMSEGYPTLHWSATYDGGAVEGYHIYRKDAGEYVNGTYWNTYYNTTVHWNNMWYIPISDPSITTLTDIYSGEGFMGDPTKGYLEDVSWYDSACPHEYWITAYNAAGESAPSQVITLTWEGEEGNPPSNTDEVAPAAPAISKLWVEWHDDSCYGSEWDGLVGGYLRVAWDDDPTTAAIIDEWEVQTTGLHGGTSTDTVSAWQAAIDPGATQGSGTYAPYFLVDEGFGDDDDYGRTVTATVTAKNGAGSTASQQAQLVITSFPRSRALADNGRVKVEWTDLFQDTTTRVTAWEIWRKSQYGLWEKIKTFDAPLEHNASGPAEYHDGDIDYYSWYDENVTNDWTYEYKVVAKCADGIDRESVVREVTPTQRACSEAPSAPRNLHWQKINGEVLFTWDPPETGTAQYYQIAYKKTDGSMEYWREDDKVYAPSTNLVWTMNEPGEYKCFVYAYSYDTGSNMIPYMLPSYYEGTFEEHFPTASNIVTVTVTEGDVAQQARETCTYPGDFTLTATGGENQVTLTWTPSEGATYYEIGRIRSNGDSEFGTVTVPATTTMYVDTTAVPGVVYQYEVNAGNSYYYVREVVNARATGVTFDEQVAAAVSAAIDALPSPALVTVADADTISEVRAIYDSLTGAQKRLVGEALVNKLEQCEEALDLQQYSEIVRPVQAKIDALPAAANVKLSDEQQIVAARAAYEALTPSEAKRLVDTTKLVAAEAALKDVKYNFAHATATATGDWVFGTDARPTFTVTMNGSPLASTQYRVAGYKAADSDELLSSIEAPGSYRAVISGVSPYFGTVETSAFTARTEHTNLATDASFVPATVQTVYTGTAQAPSFDVVMDGLTLRRGIDYTVGKFYYHPEGTDAMVEVEAGKIIAAGEYSVTVTGKGIYSGSKTFVFAIEPAILTATYAGETVYGDAAPKLEVSVSGFVNGETPQSLGSAYVAPAVTAPAEIVAGESYELIPSGGIAPNYTFVYVAGTLVAKEEGEEPDPEPFKTDGTQYRIVSASDRRFILDVAEVIPTIGANVSIWTSNGGSNQLFTIEESEDGFYVLRNVANDDLVLDAAGAVPKVGANVSTWSYNKGMNQKWSFIPSDDMPGYFSIASASDQTYVLDAAGAVPEIGANVSIWYANGGLNQLWTFVEANDLAYAEVSAIGMSRNYTGSALSPDITVSLNGRELSEGEDYAILFDGAESMPTDEGAYEVTIKGIGECSGTIELGTFAIYDVPEAVAGVQYHLASGFSDAFVLDVAEVMPTIGANVSIWIDNAGDNQLFTMELLDDGFYALRNVANPLLVLDAAGAEPSVGANVSTWSLNGGMNQKWVLLPSDEMPGYYRIASASNTYYVLDAAGAAPEIGANVSIWYDNGGLNQLWKLVAKE